MSHFIKILMYVEEMSNILTYITSANPTLGVITMVPNSLGPSELLLHYGTEEQKEKYFMDKIWQFRP